MESENVHNQHQHQQLQDQEFSFGAYSSLLAQPSYKAASVPSNLHDWNPNTILNNGSSYNTYLGESIPSSKDLWPKSVDHTNRANSMTCTNQNYGSSNADHELLLAKLKEEASASPFPTWSHEMSTHRPSNAQDLRRQSQSDALWSNHFSFGNHMMAGSQPSEAELYLQESASFRDLMAPTRSYISTADLTSSLVSSSLSLNLEAFDFLRSANYDGTSPSNSSSQASFGYLKELASSSSHDDHMMQELRDNRSTPSNNSTKRSASLTNGAPPVTKRPNGFPNKQKEALGEAKKSRVVAARSSCPPLKVRKEKLGDRIAALQKLVAPFGKTDTASVLTEAIGYIQFLHDQVQTLSVPYMKSNRGAGRPPATMQGGSREEDGREEARGDLRSRGLCLVPQSCASYINGYDGGMWAPP